jgi:hypothetical protein
MRCMACGGEMVLINAIEDWTMPVLGFERHAYMCLGCGNTEQLTAFNKQAKEKHDAEIVAILAPTCRADCTDRKSEDGPGLLGTCAS